MKLEDRAIGVRKWEKGGDNPNWNMQEDGAAFEAWALILHTCLESHPEVRLERQGQEQEWGELPKAGSFYIAPGLRAGHYSRFLYRLMKFDAAYPWFVIGDRELSGRAGEFRDRYLRDSTFCNNIPEREAGVGEEPEALVEAAFFERFQGLLSLYAAGGRIHRQLPVGLFQGEKSQDTSVFTGGKSAVDLWGVSGDTLCVFELKTGNEMAGIITELMFYCHYMRDMYIEENTFQPLNPGKRRNIRKLRGYGELWQAKGELTRVQGYMLADSLHPLITEDVLKEMSKGGIAYHALRYEWNHAETLEDVEILKVEQLF